MSIRGLAETDGGFGRPCLLVDSVLPSRTVDTREPASRTLDALVLCGLAVLVATTCLRSYRPYTFLFRDGSFYAQTNRSIARGLTLRQEEFQPRSWYDGSLPWYRNLDVAWSNVSVGSGGEWFPKHSILMPIASTPFFVVLGVDGLLVFNALAMVLALFFGYRLAARFSPPEAAAVAVFVVSGCPLVPYLTYAYSHDVFYAALAAGGCEALASRRPGAGGFLLGLSVVAKVTNVLVAAPLALALAGRDRRAFRRAVAFGAAPLAAFAAANWVMYGSPLATSYHRILTVRQGTPSVETWDVFGAPLVEGLRRFFRPSAEGELAQMALLPLAAYLGGSPFLARRTRALAVALVVSLAGFLVVFAKYRYGGARFFMPWLVLSLTPGAALLDGVVCGASVVRERTWCRWTTRGRRLAAWAVAMVAAGAVGWSWWAGRPRPTASMARDVERLDVRLDDIPCDYFNMSHMKWECSHLDPGGRYYVGLALGDECPGMEGPVLVIPAHPGGKTRRVRWSPQVAGARARVAWTWDKTPPGPDARWTLRVGESADLEMESSGPLTVTEVPGPVTPGQDIVLTVPPGRDARVLCVSLEVVE